MDSEGLSIRGIHVFEIAPPLHQQEAPTVQIHFFFASPSVVSQLMTSFWCVWKRKQHFLFQTLFSSQTAVLPKSFSSVFNVFIKDVFVNLWSYLVFSSLFFGTDWSQKRRQAENPNYISTAPLSLSVSPHIFGGQKAKSGRTSSLISLTETPDSTAVCFQSVLHLLDFVCSILFVIFCKLVRSDLLKRRRSPKPTVVPPQDSITLQHVDSNHSVHKKLSNRSITHIITDITEPHRGTRATRSSSDFCH